MADIEPHTKPKPKGFYMSLRLKLIISLTLLFTVAFAGIFYWFYNFVSDQTWNLIKADAQNTLAGALEGIDGDEFEAFVNEAPVNADHYTDDPRYWEHVQWLYHVHEVEPRAFVYTYIAGAEPNEVVYIGSHGAVLTPPKGAPFKFSEPNSTLLTQGLSGPIVNESFNTSTGEDDFGNWGVTTCTPIKNSKGEIVGALGIDFQTDYVTKVQDTLLKLLLAVFGVIYVGFFLLIWFYSNSLARPITRLTQIARQIGDGHYDQNLEALTKVRLRDEIGILAEVFDIMVNKVEHREQTLRQEVQRLQIEIDETKRQNQVNEIVETEFFQELVNRAQEMRERKRARLAGELPPEE
ncbi:MAG TPA: HAMP domain-containing protein [Anaerolineaceae bacterium]|nr:HAMP domain-containing protein [Anaerolineaceae bacterium]